jgi:hypothetical protein
MPFPAKVEEIMKAPWVLNLYERWQDEKQYEDIEEYRAAATRFAGVPCIKAYKRPFGFAFEIEGKKYKVTVKAAGRGRYNMITEALR